jgi:hypothetical protein
MIIRLRSLSSLSEAGLRNVERGVGTGFLLVAGEDGGNTADAAVILGVSPFILKIVWLYWPGSSTCLILVKPFLCSRLSRLSCQNTLFLTQID